MNANHFRTKRYLIVTADDFGIGPETSRGILELAAQGIVTSTVLLVNSPFAEDAVARWRDSDRRLELGWHPCLTLDAPVLPPSHVPSLVTTAGRFPSLGQFLKRLLLGQLRRSEIEAEFRAQYERFVTLTGFSPPAVNAHHHLHIFRPVGEALAAVLSQHQVRPYLRRVLEPLRAIVRVPGARRKRWLLNHFGQKAARHSWMRDFPGNDQLLGITNPPVLRRRDFFHRWLSHAEGNFVELSCHPGIFDQTLEGRDGTLADGHIQRRVREYDLLNDPTLPELINARSYQLVTGQFIASYQTAQPTRHQRFAA